MAPRPPPLNPPLPAQLKLCGGPRGFSRVYNQILEIEFPECIRDSLSVQKSA